MVGFEEERSPPCAQVLPMRLGRSAAAAGVPAKRMLYDGLELGYVGRQPRTFAASRASATSAGGSPARRGASRAGTWRPLTFSTAATTSRTE